MRRTGISATALAAMIALAGCAGDPGGATPSPVPPTLPPPSAPPSPEPQSPEPATPEPTPDVPTTTTCSTAAGAAAVPARIRGFAFTPDPLAVKVGDIVGWTNEDAVPHTVTMDDGSCTSGSLGEGATALLVFESPGTYPFHCRIHPTMTGTVEVTE
jgi:plastocyanin